jgi:hypothetical protein
MTSLSFWFAFAVILLGVALSTVSAGLVSEASIPQFLKLFPRTQVMGGIVLATIGGVLMTHAWDNITRQQQRAAMLNILAMELIANDLTLAAPEITDTDPEKMAAYAIYSSLENDALTASMASGVFASPDDLELLTSIMALKVSISTYHNVINVVQANMERVNTGFGMKNPGVGYAKLRRSVQESNQLRRVRDRSNILRSLLIKYGVDMERPLFKIPDEPTDNLSAI